MRIIRRSIFIELEDSEEGHQILDDLIILLSELRYKKAYIHSWMQDVPGPLSDEDLNLPM